MTGTDSVIDHWSPYGPGDMLEKPISTPSSISAPTNRPPFAFAGTATGKSLPLNDKGQRLAERAG